MHGGHGGGQHGRHAQDVRLFFLHPFDKGFGGDVIAQINDLKAGTFHHDAHQVLADVMQVALDGSDHDRTGMDGTGLGQFRLDQCHAGLHCSGCDQDLGHVDHVATESLAHDRHPRNQGLVENPFCRNALLKRLFRLGDHVIALAVDHCYGHPFQVSHVRRLQPSSSTDP